MSIYRSRLRLRKKAPLKFLCSSGKGKERGTEGLSNADPWLTLQGFRGKGFEGGRGEGNNPKSKKDGHSEGKEEEKESGL